MLMTEGHHVKQNAHGDMEVISLSYTSMILYIKTPRMKMY